MYVYLAIFAIVILAAVIPVLFRLFCGGCIAGFVTPPAHTRYGEYKHTEAYASLVKEGFGVKSQWASDAVAKIKK